MLGGINQKYDQEVETYLAGFFISIYQVNEVFSKAAIAWQWILNWSYSKSFMVVDIPKLDSINEEILSPVPIY